MKMDRRAFMQRLGLLGAATVLPMPIIAQPSPLIADAKPPKPQPAPPLVTSRRIGVIITTHRGHYEGSLLDCVVLTRYPRYPMATIADIEPRFVSLPKQTEARLTTHRVSGDLVPLFSSVAPLHVLLRNERDVYEFDAYAADVEVVHEHAMPPTVSFTLSVIGDADISSA